MKGENYCKKCKIVTDADACPKCGEVFYEIMKPRRV